MRFRRRTAPRLDPKFLVQTTGVERSDRAVPSFSAVTASGESWSSSCLVGTRATLMLFVKDHCDGCREFLVAADDPHGAGLVDDERLIMVIGPDDHEAANQLLAASGVETVLVGPEAARALRVPGAPFFSLIAPSGVELVSEGVAFGLAQVRDHCRHGLAGTDLSVPRLDADG